jgi:hypothetical protein
MKRSWTDTQKRAVAAEQGWMCRMCRTTLSATYQCDHIVPLHRGGPDTLQNAQVLCPDCHAKKTQYEMCLKEDTRVIQLNQYLCLTCYSIFSPYVPHKCIGVPPSWNVQVETNPEILRAPPPRAPPPRAPPCAPPSSPPPPPPTSLPSPPPAPPAPPARFCLPPGWTKETKQSSKSMRQWDVYTHPSITKQLKSLQQVKKHINTKNKVV